MLFNIFFICYNWYKRPLRNPSVHFNLATLTILWFEFIVMSCLTLGMVVFSIDHFPCVRNRWKIWHASAFVVMRYAKIACGFSTFLFIKIFNPSNFLGIFKRLRHYSRTASFILYVDLSKFTDICI